MTNRRDYGTGSVTARGKNRWRVQVEFGTDPVTGRRRRRRLTVTGSKRDAQRALREALAQRDRGISTAPERLTVADWLRRWLTMHSATADLAESTRTRYEQIIEKRLIPAIGQVRLRSLRPDMLAEMHANHSRELAPGTLRQHHVVMKSALREAVRASLIATNPADAVSRPRGRHIAERRALGPADVRSLVVAASGTRLDAPIRLALATGARQGELLALAWNDIDLDRATLAIRRSARARAGGGVTIGEPKTPKARRTLEISQTTVGQLRAHRIVQMERRLAAGPAWTEQGLVFPSHVGTYWLARNFYRAYRVVVSASGISEPDEVTFHALRHTAATQWLAAGADIHVVSRRLGHASPGFTMGTYGHLLSGMQSVAAAAFDDLLGAT